MRLSNWLIGLVAAAIFAAAWVVMNQPVVQEPFRGDIAGFSYSAWRQDPNTLAKREPTPRRDQAGPAADRRARALGPHL